MATEEEEKDNIGRDVAALLSKERGYIPKVG